MKTTFIALMACFALLVSAENKINSASDSFNFTSSQMHFQLSLPVEWQNKIVNEESENSVVFRYTNPGYSKPVFLFAINKVSEKLWMDLKENIYSGMVLIHQDGNIVYSETTRENSLRGKNNEEFKQMLARVNEVVKTFKEI
ncbi:MAG: hypothetical protein WCI97_05745 [Bacteroidota bacterium]